MAGDNNCNTALIKSWYTLIRHLLFRFVQHLQLSYLPPLMVYPAAGISGLTGIVGTFSIKGYLDLPAEFLAMLGFWAGLPWALKMPLGHAAELVPSLNEQCNQPARIGDVLNVFSQHRRPQRLRG